MNFNTIEPLQGVLENTIEHEDKLMEAYTDNPPQWYMNLKRQQWAMKLKLKILMIICLQILRLWRMKRTIDMDQEATPEMLGYTIIQYATSLV